MTDDLVFRAAQFAHKAHEGQKDKCGLPAIGHPEAVARLAHEAGMTKEAVAAAWLHDTVEDCDVPIGKVAMAFGDRVATLVLLLTRSSWGTYADYIGAIVESGNIEAIRLKLFDLAHNSSPERHGCIEDDAVRRGVEHMARTRYAQARIRLEAALRQTSHSW